MLWPGCQYLGAGPASVISKVMDTSSVTCVVTAQNSSFLLPEPSGICISSQKLSE